MSNLITEIYDKQSVVDNLNQLGELINSSLNAIVASAPKLQSPIDYLTAVQSISEIEKKNTEVTQAKAKALSDLDKAYQQADKAMNQSIALEDEEYKEVTKLTNEYKEKAKEQRQLLELERTRQQTMQNSAKLLSMEAKTEAELRMQQQQLIKASQSLRLTNAEENKIREQLIAKINANKEALKGMTNEVSRQKDNIGNYKSALEGVAAGHISVKEAIKAATAELTALEAKQATGAQLTQEEQQRYAELNTTLGQLKDIQGDVSARTQALANDNLTLTAALQGIQGAVGGITAVSGAMSLFGIENEKAAATIQKLTGLMSILQGLQAVEKALNKDSALMTALRAKSQANLNKEMAAGVVATGAGTAATATFTAAEGAATAGAGFLTTAVKAVGTAIKSIPIVGWLIGGAAALTAIVALISDSNEEEEKGNLLREHEKQLLDDIQKKHAGIINDLSNQNSKLNEQIRLMAKLGKGSIDYQDTLKSLAEFTGLNAEFIEQLTEEQKIQINNIYTKYKQEEEHLKELNEISAEYDKKWEEARQNQYSTDEKARKEAIKNLNWWANASSDFYKKSHENTEQIVQSEERLKENRVEINKIRQQELDWLAKQEKKQKASASVAQQERQSRVADLTIEERFYLLRKKINEEREREELPAMVKVNARIKEMADMTDILNGRLQSALYIIQYEYTKAINEATTAEQKSKLTKEQQRKEIEMQIEYSKRMLETLPPQTDEWYKMAKAIEEYKKQLGDLNKYEEPEWLKKAKDRIEATVDMVTEINNYAQTVSDFQLQRLKEQDEAYDAEYERQKEYINNTVLNEAEKNKKLEALDRQKTAHDKAVAKERAEIERRKAIFDASVQAAQAISHAVGSVGELLATSAGGDAYSAVARYIAAIAAGATAVATVISLVSQMISIPQYANGGTAEANKPFIAGEKGREIGVGMRTGKVYDFSKPTLFKANEPINIKNATETKQIINNNTEYNKDVTLKNTIMVKVIDNARVVKYFKL